MNIGFIGLGVMGRPMARHLGAGGHRIALYDIDPEAARRTAADIADAIVADSPRAVAEQAEIVFTMLHNGRIVNETACGRDGLIEGFRPGALLIDTSSSEPWITKETASRLAEKSIEMIDAPVSGAQEGAESGTLVFMVGGSDEALARARPLLGLMGEHVFHLGPVGAGHAMKTINNLTTSLTFMATAEAMLIGKAHGLNCQAMLDVLNVSTGMSFLTQKRFAQFILSRTFTDAFKLELMLKDMGIANQLARDAAVPVPMSALAHQFWTAADQELGPNRSVTEIVRWYERMTGYELLDDE